MQIDLNCDLGEGCAYDAELMPYIDSANVACGFHAGDALTALKTLTLAKQHNVRVGAHPGFNDRENFGRRELSLSEEQIYAECTYQIGALIGLAKAVGHEVSYVKPHGALYNLACRDEQFARPVIDAVSVFELPLFGLPDSKLQAMSEGKCPFIVEGFADRRYLPDGSLVPRAREDAFVTDPDEAVKQAERLIQTKGVQTLCVHGDNPQAVDFVRALREAMDRRQSEKN